MASQMLHPLYQPMWAPALAPHALQRSLPLLKTPSAYETRKTEPTMENSLEDDGKSLLVFGSNSLEC